MKDFKKPEPAELKKKLSSEQFAVTQKGATEPRSTTVLGQPQARIYVDVVWASRCSVRWTSLIPVRAGRALRNL